MLLREVIHWLSGALPGNNTPASDACSRGDAFCFHAATVAGAAIHIAVIVVLAIVIRYLVHRLITRVIRRTAHGLPVPLRKLRGRARELLEVTDEIPLVNERRAQRAQTIGTVLNSAATMFVFGTAFIMVLRELGLDIAPVLTSAGIVGVAIGFGAQNLVRDFLSGMFMILEDQYGVGDVIDAGPASGTVEAVGLRTTRLRDVNGTVWHVRNGEIARVGNMSQNWSRVVLDVPLPYETDVDRAAAVIKTVAVQIAAEPGWAEQVLGEPEVWGLEQLTGDGMVVRLAMKTRPLKQWDVGRELRTRLKSALDEAGLRMPRQTSEVWVHSPAYRDGSPGDGSPGAGSSQSGGPAAGREASEPA